MEKVEKNPITHLSGDQKFSASLKDIMWFIVLIFTASATIIQFQYVISDLGELKKDSKEINEKINALENQLIEVKTELKISRK